jgi:hypothetical protein
MSAYILMISKKGCYVFHSVHADKATAEEWLKCKQHDGEDCALLLFESKECITDCINDLEKIAQNEKQ